MSFIYWAIGVSKKESISNFKINNNLNQIYFGKRQCEEYKDRVIVR